LKSLCDSQLERDWLDFLDARRLRLPERAQQHYEGCKTRPDFSYTGEQTVVYVDGPHHEYPERRARDQNQTTCMEDTGYSVLRFADRAGWDDVVARYPSVFGTPAEPARPLAGAARSAFDESLFPTRWQAPLSRLAAEGFQIEPGRDVTSKGRIIGRTVAELRRGEAVLDVVDAGDAGAAEVVRAIAGEGRLVQSVVATAADVVERLREVLESKR
jgi:hypothetical protein